MISGSLSFCRLPNFIPNRWPRENHHNFCFEHQIEIVLEVTERGQIVVSFLYVSDTKVKIVTCGTSYKFALLERFIIRSYWDIVHKSALKNLNSIRLVALERGCRRLLHVTISELDDPQLNKYIRFNIELIQSEKRCVVFFNFA